MVEWQGSLFSMGAPTVAADAPTHRVGLDETSWIDVTPGFLHGADDLCAELIGSMPWRQHRRRMYERVLDDPRLSCWFTGGAPAPHPALGEVRAALAQRYGRPFGGPGLNHYRDGNDSVAFHRDRELRLLDDTMVAILTLGARRPFLVRPTAAAGRSTWPRRRVTCWSWAVAASSTGQHGVPKVARAGARVSVSWRWSVTRGPHTPRRRAAETTDAPAGS